MNKIDNLYEYVKKLNSNYENKDLYYEYREDIEKVTPRDAFVIFNRLIEEKMDINIILSNLDKVINVFYKNLKVYEWKKPEKDEFSYYLLLENKALMEKLESMKEIIKTDKNWFNNPVFKEKFFEIKEFPVHYLKKENILFPIMEKKNKDFNGLKIMWALHDETRRILKEFEMLLNVEEEKKLIDCVGAMFFLLYGLIQKEELILFPVVSETINKEEQVEMLKQSLEYKYFYTKKPKLENINENEDSKINLSLERYLMILDNLPVDLTYVDEFNKVRYFNKPKDRFFPRSLAIIGRDVENCHPPDSVHVVLDIVESFRNGKKDSARFWINLKGKILLIEYFAIRDKDGIYRGTLEVSQEISEIKKLKGEKRLLEW